MLQQIADITSPNFALHVTTNYQYHLILPFVLQQNYRYHLILPFMLQQVADIT